MARENLQFFNEYFDASLEQTIEVVDDFLKELIIVKPQVVLEVKSLEDGMIWLGNFFEPQEWGKDDLHYGYVQIEHVYENSEKPVRVCVNGSNPLYLIWMLNLVEVLKKHLPISDGSPPPTIKPWLLIPDKDCDRKIVELWNEGKTAVEISEIIKNKKPQTVRNRITELRKLPHGIDILPYRKK